MVTIPGRTAREFHAKGTELARRGRAGFQPLDFSSDLGFDIFILVGAGVGTLVATVGLLDTLIDSMSDGMQSMIISKPPTFSPDPRPSTVRFKVLT